MASPAAWDWVGPDYRMGSMQGGRTRGPCPASHGFLIPPRTPHNALDLGPETGQMLSPYIVEVREPLATLVKGPMTS